VKAGDGCGVEAEKLRGFREKVGGDGSGDPVVERRFFGDAQSEITLP
jgi:hypothetical protein